MNQENGHAYISHQLFTSLGLPQLYKGTDRGNKTYTIVLKLDASLFLPSNHLCRQSFRHCCMHPQRTHQHINFTAKYQCSVLGDKRSIINVASSLKNKEQDRITRHFADQGARFLGALQHKMCSFAHIVSVLVLNNTPHLSILEMQAFIYHPS